jgi:carboxymethylenebutenolidase
MAPSTQLTSADGKRFSVYAAEPAGTPRGAVVVVQEIFGVNHHIRTVADGFARLGYLALAPALFDRIRTGVELGYDAAGIAEGRPLVTQLGWGAPVADLRATVAAAAAAGRVGVVGYCWGGSLAFLSAVGVDGVACAVGYYGGQIAQRLDPPPRAPLMLHFGEQDAGIPLADVEAIRHAVPTATVFTYPGAGHGFSCDERQSFEPRSAALARERTLSFLREHVG